MERKEGEEGGEGGEVDLEDDRLVVCYLCSNFSLHVTVDVLTAGGDSEGDDEDRRSFGRGREDPGQEGQYLCANWTRRPGASVSFSLQGNNGDVNFTSLPHPPRKRTRCLLRWQLESTLTSTTTSRPR